MRSFLSAIGTLLGDMLAVIGPLLGLLVGIYILLNILFWMF